MSPVAPDDESKITRLDGLRRDFVANVSHELRTPVAVIRANAETLLEGALEDPEQAQRFVEVIEKNAERLTDLIADLLDLSRIEAGNYGLNLRSLRVSKAVERALEGVEDLARKREVNLEVQVDSKLQVHADKRGFDQILINLLDNAVKHTSANGKVVVRSVPDARGVRIEVEDEGPGVEPEHRERIFERFFRADRGRSRDKGGTGLGLAIVKHLTDLMVGLVGVKSSHDAGAVFWLVLPAPDVEEGLADVAPLRDASQPGKRPTDALSPEEQALEGSLRRLRKRLVRMAGRVDRMIGDAATALIKRDGALAKRTIRADDKVDRDEIKTDELCIQVLTHHRPRSTDLRFISVALKIVADFERIGDLAVSVCRSALALRKARSLRATDTMQKLSDSVRSMVRDSIDAFVDADVDKALEVVARDAEVDKMYHKVSNQVLAAMRADPTAMVSGTHLLSVAKALERIGDHTTNIAEQLVFLVEGRDIRHVG